MGLLKTGLSYNFFLHICLFPFISVSAGACMFEACLLTPQGRAGETKGERDSTVEGELNSLVCKVYTLHTVLHYCCAMSSFPPSEVLLDVVCWIIVFMNCCNGKKLNH